LISLTWSPTDAVIACGTQERSVHFWRLSKGRESEMSGFSAKPRALSWDSEGKLLATSGDTAVGVWAFEGKGPEGKPPTELVGHQALCTTLAFHPKLPRLASGADDTGVLIWDPRRRSTPLAFGFLEETVTGLAWTPGGRLLIGTDAAGYTTAWRTDSLVSLVAT
jgi:WD40 repeat protein